jgi:hypothetical protein
MKESLTFSGLVLLLPSLLPFHSGVHKVFSDNMKHFDFGVRCSLM